MINLHLGITRFLLPSARNVSHFVYARSPHIVLKPCIASSLPLKLSPSVKHFNICSAQYQEVKKSFETVKPNTASKKKPQRIRRTIIEDEINTSNNLVLWCLTCNYISSIIKCGLLYSNGRSWPIVQLKSMILRN